MIQPAIDRACDCRREVTTSISALRDHNHGQSWICEWSIGSKQTDPAALTDASSSLSSHCLTWIVGFPARAVVHRTDHSWDHALPNITCNFQLATHFRIHLVELF